MDSNGLALNNQTTTKLCCRLSECQQQSPVSPVSPVVTWNHLQSLSVVIFITHSANVWYFVFTLQKFYLPCSRQLRRNESTARSPVYAHFSETLSGATSIRAFGVADKFRRQNEKLVDQSNVYFYAFISASRCVVCFLITEDK